MRGLILLYHRVIDEDGDPWSLCVSPVHFREHVALLRRRGLLTPLADCALASRPHSAGVAITFDDGYVDNLINAKPILAEYDAPATVFVMTASLDRLRTFWWDDLEHILLRPGRLPPQISLRVADREYSWSLGTHARYEASDFAAYRTWRAEMLDAPTPRHTIYRELYPLLKFAHPAVRALAMSQLQYAVVLEGNTDISCRRGLLVGELEPLVDGGLIDIGAHSVTHANLPGLTVEGQAAEINHSKATLEQAIPCQVQAFAYPHGSYSPDTLRLVGLAGFARACSTDEGPVTAASDVFRLPRMVVGNWCGDEFEARLDQWLGN